MSMNYWCWTVDVNLSTVSEIWGPPNLSFSKAFGFQIFNHQNQSRSESPKDLRNCLLLFLFISMHVRQKSKYKILYHWVWWFKFVSFVWNSPPAHILYFSFLFVHWLTDIKNKITYLISLFFVLRHYVKLEFSFGVQFSCNCQSIVYHWALPPFSLSSSINHNQIQSDITRKDGRSEAEFQSQSRSQQQ